MMRLRLPGRVGRAYRAGDNLVLDHAVLGRQTWAEFLATTVEQHPPVTG